MMTEHFNELSDNNTIESSPDKLKEPYYPYVLTEAGSVFILRAHSQEITLARERLEYLEQHGLPHPDGIKRTRPDELWRDCPFVPENGYGEICINLAWHWEKNYDNNQS